MLRVIDNLERKPEYDLFSYEYVLETEGLYEIADTYGQPSGSFFIHLDTGLILGYWFNRFQVINPSSIADKKEFGNKKFIKSTNPLSIVIENTEESPFDLGELN